MCPNRVEELESRVVELEASVEGLTDELVECKVRIRELENAIEEDLEFEPVAEDLEGFEDPEAAEESAESAEGAEAESGDTSNTEGAEKADNADESESNDIIVA